MTHAKQDDETVTIVLVLDFKPGRAEDVLKRLVPSILKSRTEDGNLAFDLYKVVDKADRILIFERWRSQADLEAHWAADYTMEALSLFEQHLERPPQRGDNELFLIDVIQQSSSAAG